MAQSFFEALNPFSDKSGLESDPYTTENYVNLESQALVTLLAYDLTITENFEKGFNKSIIKDELDFISDILMPFHLIVGSHYTSSPYDERSGAKGILDILILPLLARKLIYDSYSEERKDANLTNIAAWFVAALIEGLRFSIGGIIASPFVIIMAFAHAVDALVDYLGNLGPVEQITTNNSL